MAQPITHIILAEEAYPKYFSTLHHGEFIVGTTLPDIHTIDKTTERDHKAEIPSLRDIQNMTPLLAGMNFHYIVDKLWSDIFVENKILGEYFDKRGISIGLKTFTDSLYYSKIKNWNTLAEYFESIYPSEKSLNLAPKTIRKWHRIITDYISNKPNLQTLEAFGRRTELPKEIINLAKETFNTLQNNETLKEKTLRLYDEFPERLDLFFKNQED